MEYNGLDKGFEESEDVAGSEKAKDLLFEFSSIYFELIKFR